VPRWGKTNSIRTLLTHGFKPIIIGTDQGAAMGQQTLADVDVPIIPVRNWDEAVLVFAELSKKEGKCQYAGEFYDTIVLDSLSGMGDIWMAKGMEVMNWTEVGVAHPGHDPRRIYAYVPEKGRQTVKALTNQKAHLILLCRETMQEETVNDVRNTYPAPELPGAKLPRELPGWIDGVLFGKFMNQQRVMMTEAEGKIVAGIRAPLGQRFPKYIVPDYGLLIKAMMGDAQALAQCKAEVGPKMKVGASAPAPVVNSKPTVGV
jgi:hypothetical protein